MTPLLTVTVTLVAVPMLRYLLRRVFSSLARRGLRGKRTRWRLRAPRLFGESYELAELRRGHRIDATATMVSRLFAAVAWPIVTIVVLDQVDVNIAFAISGAGFLGVTIAFGGQTLVADFLAGLHILLEDRFGEGDELSISIHDEAMVGRVTAIGAFATRLETDDATVHIANRHMDQVVNLSQRGVTATLAVSPSFDVATWSRRDVEAALQSWYAITPGHDALHDGVVVDQVDRHDDHLAVVVRTARPLDDAERSAMIDVIGHLRTEGGTT